MEEGTIVHVDYDLYNADSGDLIETTREEVAKEHDMHQEGRTYTQWTCEETIDETTGEPVLTRIVSDTSKPAIELYDTTADCVTQATTNYAYYKGAVPVVMFSAVLLLMLILNKTRLGRRMRAVADNPELAASSGINIERVHMTSAFLSAGIKTKVSKTFELNLIF